jgi:dolichol-phosphate mannosyltransferase
MKPRTSIVIPTYNESQNIPLIIPQLDSALKKQKIPYEVIVVDDNSPDKTSEVAQNLSSDFPITIIKRTEKRGLSSAIFDGFCAANGEIVGVIDADLSHPPELVPQLIKPLLLDEADMSVGSRYCKEGGVERWSLFRRLVSIGATGLAKMLTPIKDPMSGFFFMRKKDLDGIIVKSEGYKILLEILVKLKKKKGRALHVLEIPYLFKTRDYGSSKLDMKQYLLYVKDISYLFRIKLGNRLN